MRLWSLHPRYLDARGLVALWREALLAQAVLWDRTVGYKSHPQLLRFRRSSAPRAQIAIYLQVIHAESLRRGYDFDRRKIAEHAKAPRLTVTRGQLEYEWRHLKRKLKHRDPSRLKGLGSVSSPEPHPRFRVVAGGIAKWEAVPQKGMELSKTVPR
jgi:pyrimidine dimer DNA glycosylase